jgi:Putative zinc finger in N-recognin (UBR box)
MLNHTVCMIIPTGDNGESTMRWCLATTPPPPPPLPFESGSSSKRRAARRGVGAEVVYRCFPCGMTNICLACARSCHGGHAVEVLFKGRSSVTSTPATAAATAASATASTIATATAAGPACGCSAVPATCECRWTPVAGNTLCKFLSFVLRLWLTAVIKGIRWEFKCLCPLGHARTT